MVEETDIVLVAVMNNPRDLEIARLLGWYRIPLRHAPKMPNVDCLAFYQTGRFGAERWAIHQAARVRGHELVTRAELLADEADHPRANEEYYKMLLGPLEPLPRAIPSHRWRRLTFLYTTGERLLAAQEINELVIQSRERELLWRALRERGLHAERDYHTARGAEIDLAFMCANGNLGVLVDSLLRPSRQGAAWQQLHLTSAEIDRDLPGCVEKVEHEVHTLGGVKPPAGKGGSGTM